MIILGGLGILLGAVLLVYWFMYVLKVSMLRSKGFKSKDLESVRVWLVIPFTIGLISSGLLYEEVGYYSLPFGIIAYSVMAWVLLSMHLDVSLLGKRNFRYWFRDLEKVKLVWDLEINEMAYRENLIRFDIAPYDFKKLREISRRFNRYVVLSELSDEINSLDKDTVSDLMADKHEKLSAELNELRTLVYQDRDIVMRTFGLHKRFRVDGVVLDASAQKALNTLDRIY